MLDINIDYLRFGDFSPHFATLAPLDLVFSLILYSRIGIVKCWKKDHSAVALLILFICLFLMQYLWFV